MSRKERGKKNLSGCSIKAYRLKYIKKQIQKFCDGKDVGVPVYSRKAESNIYIKKKSVNIHGKGFLLFDGRISCIPHLSSRFNLVLFFYQENKELWLKKVILRDVDERYYDPSESHELNLKKIEDVKEIYYKSESYITRTVGLGLSQERKN